MSTTILIREELVSQTDKDYQTVKDFLGARLSTVIFEVRFTSTLLDFYSRSLA